jgi:molecular chaperone HscA
VIQSLKNALGSGDKDLILKSIDELNEFTRPFAERLMNTAISTAMKGKAIE